MLIVILTDPFILVMNPTRPRRIDGAAESGTLYHPMSGTLTFQKATSRKNFLTSTCVSVTLFMMSTPSGL